MPKYGYKCPECGREEETTKSFGDRLPNCPTIGCDAKPKRIWSANINIANLKAEH